MVEIVPASSVGLYRDDGLCAIEKSGPELSRIEKRLVALFKKYKLKIKAEINVTRVNYLDVTLDLKDGTYRPYRKPNDNPTYVHAQSNHPPLNLKAIPRNVNYRLSTLSSNKQIFDEEAPLYQRALDRSGYNYKLEYQEPVERPEKKKPRRQVLWFNPPFSRHVTTKVGKLFFEILDSSFPKGKGPLSGIFNRSTIKLSFSTVRNIKSIIDSNTRKKLNPTNKAKEPCNCQKGKECPMDRVPGGCRASEVVYEVDVEGEKSPVMTYYGQTQREFKKRWIEHKHAMNNENSPHATALSNYVHKLKKRNEKFTIKCSVKSSNLYQWCQEMHALCQGKGGNCTT